MKAPTLTWSMSRIGNSLRPLLQRLQQLGVELLAGLAVDLARLHVDDVLGEVAAVQVVVADQKLFQALIGELLGETRGDLPAGLDRDLAGLGVDQVARRLDAAHVVGRNGMRHPSLVSLSGMRS